MSDHRQQVIQEQQQRLAQLYDHGLPRHVSYRQHATAPPAADGVLADPKPVD